MSYIPPHKRNAVITQEMVHKKKEIPKKKIKDEFPNLIPNVPVKPVLEPKMNFASLFKNVEKKKKKVKKLKWGTVLLTKHGMIDSMTAEEREQEETLKNEYIQEDRLLKIHYGLIHKQNIRREYDPFYESPDELVVSTSEEEEEEEEEIITDEEDDCEFEPEI